MRMTDCGATRETPLFPLRAFRTVELSPSAHPCFWASAGRSCCCSPTNKRPRSPGLHGQTSRPGEGGVGLWEREKEPFLCVKWRRGKGSTLPAPLSVTEITLNLFFVNHDSADVSCSPRREKDRWRGWVRVRVGVGVGGEKNRKYTPHFLLHACPNTNCYTWHTPRRLCSSENNVQSPGRGPWVQKVYSEETLKTQCQKTLRKI